MLRLGEGDGVSRNAEDIAEKLLDLNRREMARILITDAARIHERSSSLWALVRDFDAISHDRQCSIVTHTIKGFALLPPEEQAEAVRALGPQIRAARRGWEAAARQRERELRDRGLEAESEAQLPPLVGAKGRRKADPDVVDVLDAAEAALLRIDHSRRARLHRRLDASISRHLTPSVSAAMMAKLSDREVEFLQEWLVDEKALPKEAAHRLVGTLVTAGQAADLPTALAAKAGDMAADASRQIADGAGSAADALWRLSEEFAEADVDQFWPDWLQGRSPSPTPSVTSVASRFSPGVKDRRGLSRAAYSPRRGAVGIGTPERRSTFRVSVSKSHSGGSSIPEAGEEALASSELFLWCPGAAEVSSRPSLLLAVAADDEADASPGGPESPAEERRQAVASRVGAAQQASPGGGRVRIAAAAHASAACDALASGAGYDLGRRFGL